jgi:hypothetical protein
MYLPARTGILLDPGRASAVNPAHAPILRGAHAPRHPGEAQFQRYKRTDLATNAPYR